MAIGTETDGSITYPASVNSIVGLKPTVGLVSRSGIIPISFTQDTAGPMGRTVRDVAFLLDAIKGFDPDDKITVESKGKGIADFSSLLDTNALKGKRIGIENKPYENQFLNRLHENVLSVLRDLGAEIVQLNYLEQLDVLGNDEFEMLKWEFKHALNQYLATTTNQPKTLKDLIDYNATHQDEVMPTFRQDIFEECQTKGEMTSKEYLDLKTKVFDGSRKILDNLMKEYRLDAFGGLTGGPACMILSI